jgi:hypothetical protein
MYPGYLDSEDPLIQSSNGKQVAQQCCSISRAMYLMAGLKRTTSQKDIYKLDIRSKIAQGVLWTSLVSTVA